MCTVPCLYPLRAACYLRVLTRTASTSSWGHGLCTAFGQGSPTMFVFPRLLIYLILVSTRIVSLSDHPAQVLSANVSSVPQLQMPNGSLPPLTLPMAPPQSNLSALMLQCDAERYGDDLRYASCYEAYEQIPHLVGVLSFGPRTQGNWDVRLPYRVYSCMCLC